MTHTQKTFVRGDRVRVKRIKPRGGPEFGGWIGTVVCVPPELGGPDACPAGLYGVVSLDGKERHCIASDVLELCAEGEAFR